MTLSIATIRKTFPAALAGAALVVTGCSDTATRQDVSDARDNLHEEQQELAQTRTEAQQEVADAQAEAEQHTVGKPVIDEDAAEAQQAVADARTAGAADISAQKEEVAEAAKNLNTEEARLQATQARDAYVKEVEAQLTGMQNHIDQLKTQAASADGTTKQTLDAQITTLQGQHDRVKEALDDLKGADLANWEIHKEHVRTAMQGATTGAVR